MRGYEGGKDWHRSRGKGNGEEPDANDTCSGGISFPVSVCPSGACWNSSSTACSAFCISWNQTLISVPGAWIRTFRNTGPFSVLYSFVSWFFCFLYHGHQTPLRMPNVLVVTSTNVGLFFLSSSSQNLKAQTPQKCTILSAFIAANFLYPTLSAEILQ